MPFYLGKLPEKPVKPTTVFFYSSSLDGELAKHMALTERKNLRAGLPRDATSFDGDKIKEATRVVVLPSVSKHHRDKIVATYGDLVLDYDEAAVTPQNPVSGGDDDDPNNPANKAKAGVKTAVHRGGGKWYVMIGDEKVSGPHEKEEAEELAAQ